MKLPLLEFCCRHALIYYIFWFTFEVPQIVITGNYSHSRRTSTFSPSDLNLSLHTNCPSKLLRRASNSVIPIHYYLNHVKFLWEWYIIIFWSFQLWEVSYDWDCRSAVSLCWIIEQRISNLQFKSSHSKLYQSWLCKISIWRLCMVYSYLRWPLWEEQRHDHKRIVPIISIFWSTSK